MNVGTQKTTRRVTLHGGAWAAAALGWLIGVVAPAAADDDRRAALALVEQGVVALTVDQDPATAERLWQDAARRDPQLAEPLFNLALLAERDERFNDAQTLLEKLRRMDPDSSLAPIAARRLAQLQRKRSDDTKNGGPTKRRAREAAARALTAVRAGLYETGLQEAETALTLDAATPTAHAAQGLALLGLADYAAARAALSKALEQPEALDRRVLTRAKARAEGELSRAALDQKATKLLASKSYTQAAAAFSEAAAIEPVSDTLWLQAGFALELAGDLDGAEGVFAQVGARATGTSGQEARARARELLEARERRKIGAEAQAALEACTKGSGSSASQP